MLLSSVGYLCVDLIVQSAAELSLQVDCLHCMLEYIAYQGVHMDFQEAQLRVPCLCNPLLLTLYLVVDWWNHSPAQGASDQDTRVLCP